jgi:hypothetical protein
MIQLGGGHSTLTIFSHSGKEASITNEKYLPVTFEVPKVLNQRHPTVFVRHICSELIWQFASLRTYPKVPLDVFDQALFW